MRRGGGAGGGAATAGGDPAPRRGDYLFEPTISCQGYRALALWHLGDTAGAAKESAEAVALAKQLGHGHTLAIALLLDTMLAHFHRDVEAVWQKAQEFVHVCKDSFSLWGLAADALQGWAMTRRGDEDRGITQLSQSLEWWQEKGARLFAGYWMGLIAESQLHANRLADAEYTLQEAIGMSDREVWWAPEIHRLQGELELAGGYVRDAERQFRKAVELAHECGSVALEQRAAESLRSIEGRAEAYPTRDARRAPRPPAPRPPAPRPRRKRR